MPSFLLNVTTRVFDLPLPSTIPSYADFAGFMLAAATFLAMPYTFRSAGHIRVTLITARLPGKGALVAGSGGAGSSALRYLSGTTSSHV